MQVIRADRALVELAGHNSAFYDTDELSLEQRTVSPSRAIAELDQPQLDLGDFWWGGFAGISRRPLEPARQPGGTGWPTARQEIKVICS